MPAFKCRICGVSSSSYSCMLDHLLGRQHQQRAATTPPGPQHPWDTYIGLTVAPDICNLLVKRMLGAFNQFGMLSDFRYTAAQARKKTAERGSTIFVRFEDSSLVDFVLSKAMTGEFTIRGHRLKLEKGLSSPRKWATLNRQPDADAPAPRPADLVDHGLLLATLGHMALSRPEDELMHWLADQLLLAAEQHQQRTKLCFDLQAALRSRFRTCLVQAFGSSVNGLGFRGCDLDLYAFIDADNPGSGLSPGADEVRKARAVASQLQQRTHLCTHMVRILQARVPIVKFRAPPLGGVQCDMSFRDPMACQNSRLIGWMMRADGRARLVTVAVRYWARRRNLAGGDHHPMKMSSYCLTLLVVMFLQQLQPPVLPTVAWSQAQVPELQIGHWNAAFASEAEWQSANTAAASRLLRQFFLFYAEFPAELQAVCPLLGRPVPRALLTDRSADWLAELQPLWARFCDLVADERVAPLASDTPLVLQDPFELNFNVARNLRQVGLNRFRDCCRAAIGMPFARLFDEEALGKVRKEREMAAVAAAAAVVAAAAAASKDVGTHATSAGKRALETNGDRSKEPTPKRVDRRGVAPDRSGDGGGVTQSSEVDTSGRMEVCGLPNGQGRSPAPEVNGATAAPQSLAGAAADADSGSEAVSSSVGGRAPPSGVVHSSVSSAGGGEVRSAAPIASQPAEANSGGEEAAGEPADGSAGVSVVRTDPAVLQRVLADFDASPSRVVSIPMAGGHEPRSDTELRRHAAAFARFLQHVFSAVLRFECKVLSFDGLDVGSDVVQGFTCTARFPSWEFRKTVAAHLVGHKRSLEFETDVTERALKMWGKSAAAPLAAFSCYLVLQGEEFRLAVYDGDTAKAGKNCHPFVASFLPELARHVDYIGWFNQLEPT